MGPWLYSYTKMIINRYATLEAVFNNYEISGVTVIEPESYLLAMKNTLNLVSRDHQLIKEKRVKITCSL